MNLKNIYKAFYSLVVCALLVACNQPIKTVHPHFNAQPTLIPSSTISPTDTATPVHNSGTPRPTPVPTYARPTLIPTIEPAEVPDLLKKSLSIETLSALNGHSLQRITGWRNGFTGNLWDKGSIGGNPYIWMDSDHVLLFPATGESLLPNWSTVTARPVVMNLKTGGIWLPPTDRSLYRGRWYDIILPRWSPKLQMLVTGEKIGQEEGASTFTADGKRLAHYEGELLDISPSAEKIFVIGDTWIDLASGKKVNFGWGPGFGDDEGKYKRWFPSWSHDENQIYFCCWYYGNAKKGEGYRITNPNALFNGGPGYVGHTRGEWLNEHTVLAYSDWLTGPKGFYPIFDVSERTYHSLEVVAGVPDEFNDESSLTSISPNGNYMSVEPSLHSETNPQAYLVNLKTLKAEFYRADSIEWSGNGKYALIGGSQVLTLSNKTMRPVPPDPDSNLGNETGVTSTWHPTDGVKLFITKNKTNLFVKTLNFETLTWREKKFDLPSNFYGDGYSVSTWNPKGNWLALTASDGSLWKLDYPQLEHFEQLTPPLVNVSDVSWSPNGQSIAYISGKDIYIVEAGNNP
jgi:hypothetical protein